VGKKFVAFGIRADCVVSAEFCVPPSILQASSNLEYFNPFDTGLNFLIQA
jgi:hypothetical protein